MFLQRCMFSRSSSALGDLPCPFLLTQVTKRPGLLPRSAMRNARQTNLCSPQRGTRDRTAKNAGLGCADSNEKGCRGVVQKPRILPKTCYSQKTLGGMLLEGWQVSQVEGLYGRLGSEISNHNQGQAIGRTKMQGKSFTIRCFGWAWDALTFPVVSPYPAKPPKAGDGWRGAAAEKHPEPVALCRGRQI